MSTFEHDLTKGNIWKKLVKFAVPFFISNLIQSLYSLVDPMIFVIIACAINITLDMVLVAGFHMGAGSAAFATIFAQGCSMMFCILYLKKHDFMFDFRPSSFHFVKEEFDALLRTGLPLSIQMVGTNFSFLILTTFINRAGGVAASAAAGIVNNFNGFAILPQAAFSSAAAAMIAQNMGKGDVKRSEKTMYCCLVLCLGVSVIVFALMHIFPEQIFYLFGVKADVLVYGLPYIFAFSFEYVGLPFIMSFSTVLTATGNGWITLVANMTSAFFVRIPLAYFLAFVRGHGVNGIAAAIPLATIVGAIISFGFYLSGIWRKRVIL